MDTLIIWILFLQLLLLTVVFAVLYSMGYQISIKRRIHTPNSSVVEAKLDGVDGVKSDSSNIFAVDVLNLLEEGVLVIDRDNRVQFINEAAKGIFGYSAEGASCKTLIEIVRDYEFNILLDIYRESNSPQSGVINTMRGKQILKVSFTAMKKNGDVVVIVSDITERRRLENIRRDFVANISHDLRTPIASIKALSETLSEGALNNLESSTKFVHMITEEADRLTRMVDELNELARIESGEPTQDRYAADVGHLITNCIERLRTQAIRKQVEIETEIEKKLAMPVVDRSRMEQVLINLIHNAIKFSNYGGRIRVVALQTDGEIMVSVKDNGIGIPEDELPRIFERFYKVDKSRGSEGSGIGLAICKHIIASHGGKIWAESELGKGSCFFFTIPVS